MSCFSAQPNALRIVHESSKVIRRRDATLIQSSGRNRKPRHTTLPTPSEEMDSSEQLRNPRGLIYGLLSVALGQISVVIPYYYLLRKQYIKRPFIQQKFEEEYKRRQPSWWRNSWTKKVRFKRDENHLFQLEGFFCWARTSVTWIFNLMPETYYDLDQPVNFLTYCYSFLSLTFSKQSCTSVSTMLPIFTSRAISLTTYLSPLVCLMLSMVRLWTPSA